MGDRQKNGQTVAQTDGRTDIKTNRLKDRQIEAWQWKRKMEGQTDGRIERQTDGRKISYKTVG